MRNTSDLPPPSHCLLDEDVVEDNEQDPRPLDTSFPTPRTKDDTQFTFASVLQVSIPFQLVHSCMRASLSRLLLTHGKTSLCADGQGFQIEETAPFSSVRPPKLSDGHLPSNHHGQVRDNLQSNSKKSHSW